MQPFQFNLGFKAPKLSRVLPGKFKFQKKWEVTIEKGFYISTYNVTNEEYVEFLHDYNSSTLHSGKMDNTDLTGQSFIQSNNEYIGRDARTGKFFVVPGFERHPVVYVNFYGAMQYCAWLTWKQFVKDREEDPTLSELKHWVMLPNEIEWEYVADGGGGPTAGMFKYAGSNNPLEVAFFADNSDSKLQPVGQLKPVTLPSGDEVFDMSGNVWEWCANYFEQCDKFTEEQFREMEKRIHEFRQVEVVPFIKEYVLGRLEMETRLHNLSV